MTVSIGRRELLVALGGAVAAWPLAARAQQPAMPVVGYLDSYAAESTSVFLAAFRAGLSETGYIEGRNLVIEYRYANNDTDRLPELAADLIRHRVAVIVTPFDRFRSACEGLCGESLTSRRQWDRHFRARDRAGRQTR